MISSIVFIVRIFTTENGLFKNYLIVRILRKLLIREPFHPYAVESFGL
ncbi:hypothetical protein [Sulfurisphaera ohwakuensis]|uniref:Uncharacterized protein n=1 Tax=Sulfurisphaera ohwakuensis TaxID=69656 RepID=A0A7J9RS05_SULOH|nr:hypothetical protein [Sulfurisphaera ohwakuensis]MBB5253758.1 hypothetical protein [Sulfurisphaera ohwakuensis]